MAPFFASVDSRTEEALDGGERQPFPKRSFGRNKFKPFGDAMGFEPEK
jgi:hypothetical protein